MKMPKGFTIVELLVVMAITLVLFAAFTTWFFLTLNAEQYSTNLLMSTEQARESLLAVSRELRETVPGEDGSYMIVSALPEELIFFSDVDSDVQAERIRYFRDGVDLKRGIVQASGFPITYDLDTEQVEVVATYLANEPGDDMFQYYGLGYRDDVDPLPDPVEVKDVRLIHMNVLIDVADDTSDPFRLEIDVQLRNIVTNES